MTTKIEKLEDFTYENIIKHTRYTDHLPCMLELFSVYKPDRFLEFGLGYSTKIFLEHCNNVLSIEALPNFIVDQEWYDYLTNILAPFKNWQPILWRMSEKLSEACKYQIIQKKDPSKVDSSYLDELKNYSNNLYSEYKPDVVFIDSAMFIHGDVVNIAFENNIPVIIIHDSNNVEQFGYEKIIKPENYKVMEFKTGVGTKFFIRNDYEDIYNRLNTKT